MRKVTMDMTMDCYSQEHLQWGFLISLPIIVVWVIGFPALALYLLFRNINRGDNNKVKQYFLVLYQGLKRKYFYWEFVNSLRKMLVLLVFVMLEDYRILASVIILLVTARIQIYLKPYKDPRNNDVEIYAIAAGTMILASGVIFAEEDAVGFMNLIVFIIVILINAKFLLEWFYLLFLCVGEKHKICLKIALFLAVILQKKSTDVYDQKFKKTEESRDNHKGTEQPQNKKLKSSKKSPRKTKSKKKKRRMIRKKQNQKLLSQENVEDDTQRKILEDIQENEDKEEPTFRKEKTSQRYLKESSGDELENSRFGLSNLQKSSETRDANLSGIVSSSSRFSNLLKSSWQNSIKAYKEEETKKVDIFKELDGSQGNDLRNFRVKKPHKQRKASKAPNIAKKEEEPIIIEQDWEQSSVNESI